MEGFIRWQGRSLEFRPRSLEPWRALLDASPEPPPARLAYAAAHVILKPSYARSEDSLESLPSPGAIAGFIDWDATLGFRRHLDALGFGIAEAMDTAQRFSIGWENASELIRRCGELGLANGFVAGAGVDHLAGTPDPQALAEGVSEQARFIRSCGGVPVVLPMPALCALDLDEEGYCAVYTRIAEAADGPLFVHWLGEMFLPSLAGYFPGRSFERIMAAHPEVWRGAKISLLDCEREKALRRELLPNGQIILTGDDFHFPELIRGPVGEERTRIGERKLPVGDFSHALLGVFDGIAEPASLALRFLARGDLRRYDELMEPCGVLGRHLFEAPTRHYKAGLAFLSWLNGHQSNPMLVQHEERARSLEHYAKLVELAAAAGVLSAPDRVEERLDSWTR